MSTKLAFLPTFILPVAEIVPPMCDRMLWLALFTEQWLDQPIIPYRGVISDHVGKNSQPLWQSRRWHHIRLSDLLQQLFQQATSSKSTSSLCPFISLNKSGSGCLSLKISNNGIYYVNSLYFISTAGIRFSIFLTGTPFFIYQNIGILFLNSQLLLVNIIFVDTFWLIARSMESTCVCLGEHPLHSGT